MNAGDRIRFKYDLIEDATGDHPQFLLAKKGQLGRIKDMKEITMEIERGRPKPARTVVWDGCPHEFIALDEEFVVVPEDSK